MVPPLSIIIPTKDRPTLLERALASFQGTAEVEVIVVDDGSRPNDVARNRASCKGVRGCRFLELTQSRGAAAARNHGFQTSRGNWIWFFDDDDWVLEQTVHDVLASVRKGPSENILLLPRCTLIDGKEVGLDRPANEPDKSERYRTVGIEVTTSCAVFQRDVLVALGGWDEALPALQDTDLLLRAAQIARFVSIDTEPVMVDASHSRITYSFRASTIGKLRFLQKHWRILPLRRRLLYIAQILGCSPLTRRFRLKWAAGNLLPPTDPLRTVGSDPKVDLASRP